MRQYFTTDGDRNFGPFTLEELKNQELKPDTKVWYNGLENWTPASQLEELKPLFEFMPPLPPNEAVKIEPEVVRTEQQESAEPEQKKVIPPMPDTWLVWSILATVLCCQLIGIVGIVYAAQVESEYRRGNYDKAQEYSNNARLWTIISFALGLGVIVCYIVLMGILSI